MLVATVTEAKNRLSALIDRVRGGDSVVIVDRGIPVARLEPAVTVETDADGRIARLQRAGVIRPARKTPAVELLSSAPPSPRRGASAVEALLEERHTGR
jgi:prevent-host-death family protein